MTRPAAIPALLLLAVLALSAMGTTAWAAPNPFTAPPEAHRGEPRKANPLLAPLSSVMTDIAAWQNSLRQAMSRTAEAIRDNPLGKAFWLFMGLAFAYGAAHALGPGHGKILAASYFLHREAPARQALLYAYLSMPLHVLSATALVLGGKFILRMSASRAVDDMGRVLQDVSYGLLAVMGLCMLVSALRRCRRPAAPTAADQASPGTSKGLFGLALATGLVPCPGAALVLIFSIALGITGAGVAAMVAIAMGMGLCLAAVSLLAIKFRAGMLALMRNRSPLLRAGQCAFSLAGALIVLSTGSLLLLGSLLG
jgi:ABC-type nickel/cobalt efflux system permease component RcnA